MFGIFDKLLLNSLILMTFTFFTGHFCKNLPKFLRKGILAKTFLGFLGILVSFACYNYGLVINGTDSILDLRYIVLSTVYLQGGIIPAMITGTFQSVYRILRYGYSIAAINASIQVFPLIFIFFIINRIFRKSWSKWFFMQFTVWILINLSYITVIQDMSTISEPLLYYNIVYIIASILQYLLIDSLQKSNELYEKYKETSQYDYLTNVLNRKYYESSVHHIIEKASKQKSSFSFIMVDIDHFKNINDTYGHGNGDLVLMELAKIMIEKVGKLGIIGRVGGEEFSVVLLKCSKNRAIELANDLRKEVEAHEIILDNNSTKITISIGIANYPETGKNLNQLIETADAALYDAKYSGRNKVCWR